VTKPQRKELERQALKPQPCVGPHRRRVQANLVAAGLSMWNREGSYCCITDAGRVALGTPASEARRA